MGQSIAAVLIGIAGLLVLAVYTVTEKKKIERFGKQLVDEFRGEEKQ